MLEILKNKLRRWLQLRTIRSLTKSLPEGWWLTGGWAIETITGISSMHQDIDIYVKEGIEIPKKRFLDVHIIHEENDFFVEKTPHGIFRFSKEAFESKPRSLYGIKVYTVAPELLFLLAKGSPNPREKEKQLLRLLENLNMKLDLKKIKRMLQYQPL
jgi:hypothetical protein